LGEVFRAHDTQLNRWVAVKRLHQDAAESENGKIMQEARHLAALQHPNIVTIYDFISDRNDIVVVMELLHGRTVQEIAEKAPLLQEDFTNVMRQTLEGLIAAHAVGMLHRDIKPSNLMVIDLPSGAFQVKILDFGLAKVAPEPSLQTTDNTGTLMGSIFTMSPEQFEGKPLDPRSDLYSLGCVGYFALTTYFPFLGATVPEVICSHLQQKVTPLRELRPDLPPALCEWLTRMMSLHPEDRPSSAARALEELQAALDGKVAPVAGQVVSRPVASATQEPLKRKPLAAGLVAGTVLLLAAVAFYFRPTAQVEAEPKAPIPEAKAEMVKIAPGDTAAFLKNVGKTVEVEGRIVRSGVNRSETVRYLNFADSSRRDVALVFFIKDAPADFTQERLSEYVGKDVRVTGLVTIYDGTPQVVISNLSQLHLSH
jgi:hypothetical protein